MNTKKNVYENNVNDGDNEDENRSNIFNFPAQVACGTGILLSELGMTTGDSYWMSANATQTGWKVTINGYVCPNKRAYVSNKGLFLIVFYQLALKIICLKEQYAVMIIT